MYQIISKVFTDMDAYVYMKQRKDLQDCQVVYFNVHRWFFGPDHVASYATEAERKLQM